MFALVLHRISQHLLAQHGKVIVLIAKHKLSYCPTVNNRLLLTLPVMEALVASKEWILGVDQGS